MKLILDITNLINNEDLGITNDFLYPSNCKTCEKELRYNETSIK